LAYIVVETDSIWVVMSCLSSCLTSLIEAATKVAMEEWIFLLMERILALSCHTSCWVSMKLECKVLKTDSKYWLWIWAMMMREHEKGQVGPHGKWVMGEVYHKDQGDELNPMG
jgi:hypothetical protein